MTTAKIKAALPPLPLPQSDAEASRLIAALGDAERELTRREADMNAALARVKAEVEASAAHLKRERAQLIDALAGYCAAHRERLTEHGKVKTVAFADGKVSWRHRPPKVTFKRKVEAILEALLAGPRSWRRFVRVKREIDKEAMLAAPALARAVPGVSIGSAGEDFVVEPFGTELSEVES